MSNILDRQAAGGGGGVLGPTGNLPTSPTNPTMTNILPGYSETFGPPSWVSPPTISAITAAERDADHIDNFLLGVVLANITAINNFSILCPLTSPELPTALSWSRLEAACISCEVYKLLHNTVSSGVSDKKEDWDQAIVDFFPHRHYLVTIGPVIMLHDRPVIP